jgi:hypothetical protein
MKKFTLQSLILTACIGFASITNCGYTTIKRLNGIIVEANQNAAEDDTWNLTIKNETGHDIEVFQTLQEDQILFFGDKSKLTKSLTELTLAPMINRVKTRTKSSTLIWSELKKEINNYHSKDKLTDNGKKHVCNDTDNSLFSVGIPLFRTGMILYSACKRLIPYSLLCASAGWGISTFTGKGNPFKVASITGLLCAAVCAWQIKTDDATVNSILRLVTDMHYLTYTNAESIADLPVELAQTITRAETLANSFNKGITVKSGKNIKGTVVINHLEVVSLTKQAHNKKHHNNVIHIKVKKCSTNQIVQFDIPASQIK